MNNEYKTSDFYIAAYIKASGIPLLYADKSNPRKVLFVFSGLKDSQNLAEDFLFGKGSIEPRTFVAAIKELKQLLYSSVW